jgi:hypothetical protein
MKTLKVLFLCAIPLMGLNLAGCDDKLPTPVGYIPVTSVTLDETLAAGLLMELGQAPVDITKQVTHLPENANDIAETYISSHPEIASVSGDGKVTPNSEGNTVITIMIGNGGMNVTFPVEVVNEIPIPATAIELAVSGIELMETLKFDLRGQVMLTPDNSNDQIVYSDYDTNIVSVDAAGVVRALSSGTTSIKVTSGRTPSLTKTVPVTVIPFSGYYPRNTKEGFGAEQWTMTVSQNPLPNITDCGQGVGSALDGDSATNIAMGRPGKNTSGVNLTGKEGTPEGAHWYIVDMKEAKVINSYKIVHRVGASVIQVRPWGFDEISGSNDGVNFTTITTNSFLQTSYPAANDGVADINVLFNEVQFSNTVAYRYIKFYAMTKECFYQKSFTSAGGAVQIQELYLGFSR